MTPAAALTQAAMDVTPAYATDTVDPTPLTDWNNPDFKKIAVADAKATLVVTGPDAVTYMPENQDFSSENFAALLTIEPTGESATPVTYKLDSELFELTQVKKGEDSSVVADQGVVSGLDAGTYTATVALTDGAPKVVSASDSHIAAPDADSPVAITNSEAKIIINKTPIPNSAFEPATGYVGVSTVSALEAASKANVNIPGYGLYNLMDPDGSKGLASALVEFKYGTNATGTSTPLVNSDSDPKFVDPGTVDVKVKLTTDGAKNFKLATPTGTDESDGAEYVTVQAAIEAAKNYQAKFVTTTSFTATESGASGFTAWKAATNDIKTAVEGAISVEIPAATEAGKPTPVTPSKVTYTTDKNVPVEVKDLVPGKYFAVVSVEGVDDPVAKLPFDITGSLVSDVNIKVNGAAANVVKLDWENKDIEQQIRDGFAATLAGVTPAVPVSIDNFKFDVKTPLPEADGTGQVTVLPADGSVYTGSQTITYTFGTDLPAFKLKNANRPYAGSSVTAKNSKHDGYLVTDLFDIPQVTDESEADEDKKKPLSPTASGSATNDFDVAVTYVDAAGKTVEIEDPNKDGDDADAYLYDARTYTITVKGTGDYVGTQTFQFTIDPYEVKAENVTWNGNKSGVVFNASTRDWYIPYSGSPLTPTPVIDVGFPASVGTFTPKPSNPSDKTPWNYTIEWTNNENVGKGAAVLNFSGNYKGSVEIPFNITQCVLNSANASAVADNQFATGFPEDPTAANVVNPVVTYKPTTGEPVTLSPADYEIGKVTKGATSNGVTTYAFEVKGKGNYTGSFTGTFATSDQDISKLWTAEVAKGDYVYQMGAKVPATVVVKNAKTKETVTEAGNYRLVYENDTNAGTATVRVVGIGQYAGAIELTYEIAPLEISQKSVADIKTTAPAAGYTFEPGKVFEPEVVWNTSKIKPNNYAETIDLNRLVNDLEITYADNDKAGTAQLIVSGKEDGNVTGSYAVDFAINPADITKAAVDVAAVAPGASATDAVKVTFGETELVAGTDYKVAAAEGATVPGTVAVTVTGAGNYAGEVKKDVDVLYDVAQATVTVEGAVYNGSKQTPKVEVSYTADGKKVVVDPKAYDVKVDGNATDAGTYKVTVTGDKAAGWTNSVVKDFVIAKAAGPKTATVTYTAAGMPVVTIPGLTEGKDFKVTPNEAQGKLAITYMGNYTGSATVDYTPAAKPVTPAPAKPAAGKTGWVGSGNDWAYYKDGQAVKGGWELIGGEWYHFEKSGKMTNTKWFQDADGTWYMLNQSHKGEYGAMLKGWQKDGGDWYYFAKSGAMQSGWAKVDGEWYLLNTKHDGTYGRMLTGWQQVGGKWYYMDASGKMAENEWVGRYWVNGSGVWTATR